MEPTQTARHSVSVAGVILSDDASRVLLIKRRDNGRWEPPGGVLELDETIEHGLRREIREETGVEVEVEGLTGVYKNMSRGIIALVYRCSTGDLPRSQTDEAEAVMWWPTDDAPKLMSEAYWVRVADAISSQPSQTRAHDGTVVVDGSTTHAPGHPS